MNLYLSIDADELFNIQYAKKRYFTDVSGHANAIMKDGRTII